MQGEDFYKRLGACVNLALHGSTPGERSSGQAAVDRLMAKLSASEHAILATALPNVATPPKARTHRAGTKAAQIAELLKQGMKPKDIAKQMGVRVQYVYNVRRQS
jgi:hypothetical protein